MKARCMNNSAPAFADYGGRGIKVCARWAGADGFERFLADMGRRPSDGYSIERIDNNGNYEPANCRWATAKEQGRNKRTNRLLTYRGVTKTLIEWAEDMSIRYCTAYARMRNGWDAHDILHGRKK